MSSSKTALKVADYLLQIKAIQLQPKNPFQWSSGWFAPIYCDNRKILSYPKIRNAITKQFIKQIKKHFTVKNLKCIAAVATSGIPFGTLIADRLSIPLIYVRPTPKKHGLQQQIEGSTEALKANKEILVIEDLISTGNSSLKVVDVLRQANHKVQGLTAIFSYQLKVAEQNFKQAECQYITLSNYQALLESAHAMGMVNEQLIEELQEWRQDPEQWSKKQGSP